MHLISVKGPSILLFISVMFGACELKRDNLIQKQQWHIKVKAMLLYVFEYKTERAQ